MYSTSSPQTRVTWAAHTYNVAFSDEIGHFEDCNGPNLIPASQFGVDAQGNPIACPAGNVEGRGANVSPTDGDDNFCFPGSEAVLVDINGGTYMAQPDEQIAQVLAIRDWTRSAVPRPRHA